MTEQEGTQELEIVVRGMDLDEDGFIPRYRRILQFMRAFSNPREAKPEDVDAAVEFLVEYIVKPEDEREKRKLVNRLKAKQVMDIFERIAAQDNAVPPQKPAPSGNSSESPEEAENLRFGRLS